MELQSIMTDILLLLLLILFFYGIERVKPSGSWNTDGYLSISSGKDYRGFFALVVLFNHLAQHTDPGTIFHYMAFSGPPAVAVFFFLSGYGLQKSYITKGKDYRRGFFLKRIPSVLIPYIIITLIYWAVMAVYGLSFSFTDIIGYIVKGKPVATYSWYILTILAFYIFYGLLMYICGDRHLIMIAGAVLWCIAYALFCMKMSYGQWWYNSSHLLAVGMIWATYEEKIKETVKGIYMFLTPALWISFIMFFYVGYRFTGLPDSEGITLLLALISNLLFVTGFILLCLKLKVGNRILCFLGGISLEIYITQGLFMFLFRNSDLYIGNDLLWCIAVMAGTVAFSFVLHAFFRMILRKLGRIICKEARY